MAWVRLDDGHTEHPKVVGLGAEAYRLWVAMISYSNRQRTDGWVPKDALRQLTPARYVLKVASELSRSGLVHSPGDLVCISNSCPMNKHGRSIASRGAGFVLHDYLDYQPSSAEIQEKSDKRASAGRAGGLAKAVALARPDAGVGYDHGSAPNPTQPNPDLIDGNTELFSAEKVSQVGSQLYGWKPSELVSRVAREKMLSVCPVTAFEFEEAAEKTRLAATPGLGYWAAVVDSNRKARSAAATVAPMDPGTPSNFDPTPYQSPLYPEDT